MPPHVAIQSLCFPKSLFSLVSYCQPHVITSHVDMYCPQSPSSVPQWALPLPLVFFSQVASLRQQLEKLQRGGGGGGVIGGCGPEASCGRSLLAMERAHRQALEELQKQHDRQIRELEMERDRLLREETQATAQGQVT